MAYRQGPGSQHAGPSCYRHAAATAAVACDRCMQPICDLCVVYVGTASHCPPCAQVARRRRVVGRVAMWVALVAVTVGIAFFVRSMPARFDYGARTSEVRAARLKVEAERCDCRATISYEDLLVASGDHRGALADVDDFVKHCGDWYRVHWTAYTAHHRLSEGLAAVDEATKLIAHAPGDKDYRWWRGVVYAELGQDLAAIADFEEAIRLQPSITNIPFNLADVYERQGKPCDAKRVIQGFLEHHPDGADEAVLARMARLTNTGHCEK